MATYHVPTCCHRGVDGNTFSVAMGVIGVVALQPLHTNGNKCHVTGGSMATSSPSCCHSRCDGNTVWMWANVDGAPLNYFTYQNIGVVSDVVCTSQRDERVLRCNHSPKFISHSMQYFSDTFLAFHMTRRI